MSTSDISAAFRLSDQCEVSTYNSRAQRQQAHQASNITMLQTSGISNDNPSQVVLLEQFPEHPLSLVSILREPHAWPFALLCSTPMVSIDAEKLNGAISAISSPRSALPRTITPRDAIAACMAADILLAYADFKPDGVLHRHTSYFVRRAHVRKFVKQYAGGIAAVSPELHEVARLDGSSTNGRVDNCKQNDECPALRLAERIFGGLYLGWLADQVNDLEQGQGHAQMALWRAAVVELFDLVPSPQGSAAIGYSDRCAGHAVKSVMRLQLPEGFVPSYRGEHFCDRATELRVIASWDDRVLVRRTRPTEHDEYEIGKKRLELLRKHYPYVRGKMPDTRKIKVVIVPEGIMLGHFPSFDMEQELFAKGWLAPVRLALKLGHEIGMDTWLDVARVGQIPWEKGKTEVHGEGLLDAYALLIMLVIMFRANAIVADDPTLMRVSRMRGDHPSDLRVRFPREGIQLALVYGSTFVSEEKLFGTR